MEIKLNRRIPSRVHSLRLRVVHPSLTYQHKARLQIAWTVNGLAELAFTAVTSNPQLRPIRENSFAALVASHTTALPESHHTSRSIFFLTPFLYLISHLHLCQLFRWYIALGFLVNSATMTVVNWTFYKFWAELEGSTERNSFRNPIRLVMESDAFHMSWGWAPFWYSTLTFSMWLSWLELISCLSLYRVHISSLMGTIVLFLQPSPEQGALTGCILLGYVSAMLQPGKR